MLQTGFKSHLLKRVILALMVNVLRVVSFLELGLGNIIILRKRKNICIPGAFLEETKHTEALFLLSFGMDFMATYIMFSPKSRALLVSQAIALTHSSKTGLSFMPWSYCNMEKKKRVYSISFLKPAHAWNMSQSPGRCLHVLGASGLCSFLLSTSLSTAAPEVRLGSIFLSASLL